MKGAEVKVRGVWAQIDDERVFIAYKVKSAKGVLKLRKTSDGTPHWTMTPEELAKERTLADATISVLNAAKRPSKKSLTSI
jgi:hypothetical protein